VTAQNYKACQRIVERVERRVGNTDGGPPGPNFEMQPTNLLEHLLPTSWKTQVTAWLAEDAPSFDYGGYVVGEAHRKAFLFGKGVQPAVLAGVPFVNEIFAQLNCQCVL
jgi:hypothetical protein